MVTSSGLVAGCGIQRAKIGSGGRHSAQNDHNQGCSATAIAVPVVIITRSSGHGAPRGIIGAFVFVVQDGGLCGKRALRHRGWFRPLEAPANAGGC